jgi:uncharacterized protein YuzE
MKIVATYSAEADTAYVSFGDSREVTETLAPMEDLSIDLDRDGRIVGIEFVTASRLLDPSTLEEAWGDELIGVTELADVLGKRKQNVAQYYTRRPDFPRPAAQLPTGRYWRRGDVETWLRSRGRTSAASESAEAGEWLTRYLSGGERRQKDVRVDAQRAGLKWDLVRGAAKAIGVERQRRQGALVWDLPRRHAARGGRDTAAR